MTSFWIFGTAIFTFLIPRCLPSTYLLPATILKIVSYLVLSLQLLGLAKLPMAGPGSCKGQNKVRDNFQNCGRKVQCILSIVCLQASITLMLLCKLYIFCKKVSTILSTAVPHLMWIPITWFPTTWCFILVIKYSHNVIIVHKKNHAMGIFLWHKNFTKDSHNVIFG